MAIIIHGSFLRNFDTKPQCIQEHLIFFRYVIQTANRIRYKVNRSFENPCGRYVGEISRRNTEPILYITIHQGIFLLENLSFVISMQCFSFIFCI